MKKYKIIETPDYILAVSDEEIKEDDWFWKPDMNMVFKAEYTPYTGCKKIIAYQPKGNEHELDLPLLPEIVVEEDVEKLAEEYASKKLKRKIIKYIPLEANVTEYVSFIKGYKAATKVYSEEDLRKAFEAGMYFVGEDKGSYEKFIQSLKQPKTLKWFVAEIENIMQFEKNPEYYGTGRENYRLPDLQRLKTTTINGKIYLVGKYLNG
jgi:hypothetical protein